MQMAPFPFECQSTIPGELWEFHGRGSPLWSRTQQIILTLPSITRNKFQLPRETHFSSSPLHPSIQCRSLFPENCDGQGSKASRRPTTWKGERELLLTLLWRTLFFFILQQFSSSLCLSRWWWLRWRNHEINHFLPLSRDNWQFFGSEFDPPSW